MRIEVRARDVVCALILLLTRIGLYAETGGENLSSEGYCGFWEGDTYQYRLSYGQAGQEIEGLLDLRVRPAEEMKEDITVPAGLRTDTLLLNMALHSVRCMASNSGGAPSEVEIALRDFPRMDIWVLGDRNGNVFSAQIGDLADKSSKTEGNGMQQTAKRLYFPFVQVVFGYVYPRMERDSPWSGYRLIKRNWREMIGRQDAEFLAEEDAVLRVRALPRAEESARMLLLWTRRTDVLESRELGGERDREVRMSVERVFDVTSGVFRKVTDIREYVSTINGKRDVDRLFFKCELISTKRGSKPGEMERPEGSDHTPRRWVPAGKSSLPKP